MAAANHELFVMIGCCYAREGTGSLCMTMGYSVECSCASFNHDPQALTWFASKLDPYNDAPGNSQNYKSKKHLSKIKLTI